MPCMLLGRRHVTALLALGLLASIPAAAQARTFKVDGRVAGPPTAKGGAVTVPLKLTKRAGRALKLGTRRVRVRFGLKGVTSLSRKARLRLRYRARPTLKLRRPRVVRAVRRRRAAPRPPHRRPPQRAPRSRS